MNDRYEWIDGDGGAPHTMVIDIRGDFHTHLPPSHVLHTHPYTPPPTPHPTHTPHTTATHTHVLHTHATRTPHTHTLFHTHTHTHYTHTHSDVHTHTHRTHGHTHTHTVDGPTLRIHTVARTPHTTHLHLWDSRTCYLPHYAHCRTRTRAAHHTTRGHTAHAHAHAHARTPHRTAPRTHPPLTAHLHGASSIFLALPRGRNKRAASSPRRRNRHRLSPAYICSGDINSVVLWRTALATAYRLYLLRNIIARDLVLCYPLSPSKHFRTGVRRRLRHLLDTRSSRDIR